MSLVSSAPLFAARKSRSAYQIEQSLRFRGNNTYFTKTFGSSGDRRKFTLSVWVKKATTVAVSPNNTGLNFFGSNSGNLGDSMNVGMNADTTAIQFYQYNSGYAGGIFSDALYRDPSAWMHMVFVWDSAQATQSDRMAVYVNNRIERPDGSAGSPDTGPSLNKDAAWNNSSYTHTIGGTNQTNDMYLAEAYHIDGQALDPTSFGEYDNNGVWRPIEYTGSYGTNGFYLKFDPSATNGIGHDHSGNGNNFTPSGFTTSGTGTDVMSDTPTTNWATLNPLGGNASSYSEGNLKFVGDTANISARGAISSIPVSSGKWYWEVTLNTATGSTLVGVVDSLALASTSNQIIDLYFLDNSYGYASFDGNKREGTGSGASNDSYGNSYTNGDTIGVALDLDNEALYFSKNGTWQNSGVPTSGSSKTGAAFTTLDTVNGSFVAYACGAQSATGTFNFGQREFANPPGTVGATDYFNTVLYTGDNTNQAITGVGFQPDFVWIKSRSSISDSVLQDVVRGAEKFLISNANATEDTDSGTITSFDSDGFTIGSGNSKVAANNSGETFVAWCWKAGGTASSNTDGTITSSVSANQDAGFSIVSYTGNGTSGATVGHGLGVKPSLLIVRRRPTTSNWTVYHSSVGATKRLVLDSTVAATAGTGFWNDTEPTSTVFTIGNDGGTNSTTNNTYIAYCFAEKPGVSKFGEYTGNGSSDGPVISCGFRPAMVMIKWYEGVNTAESWQMYDNKRAGNPTNTILQPDSNAIEESPSDRYIQFTADGFQLKSNGQQINRSGAKYIFMAWAATFTGSDDFKSLNTANLPAPTVKDGSEYFDTKLYTGTDASLTVNYSFSPDFVWIKSRSNASDNSLYDIVRGTNLQLRSNSNIAEINDTNGFNSFDTDGFTLGVDGGDNINAASRTYAAWAWDAGNGTSSNTNGSITSTVSANPSAGFSIVQFDGTGANGSIGHGLGVAPSFIVAKSKTHADNWFVYHSTIGPNGYIMLNQTAAVDSPNSTVWQNVSPTSTVFYASTGGYNDSGETIIAYCFAEVEGYSKFGSYTGNGVDDGPFVACNFKPAYILVKNANSSTDEWEIYDTARDPYNFHDKGLRANTSGAEYDLSSNNRSFDTLSNGFKVRGSNAGINGSGNTHIFVAFASHPFGGSGVSPATAR